MDAAAAQGSGKTSRCRKTEKDVPLAEPVCLEPRGYCKWRTACVIHVLEKEKARAR